VMRKPHINNYLTYDLYVAPSALEGGDSKDPGIIQISRGGSHWFDKYRFTFENFEFDDPETETPKTIATVLKVEYGEIQSTLKPLLDLTGEEVQASKVAFDDGRASVQIIGVSPQDGSVALKVQSSFLPLVFEPKAPTLIIELSKKPLIILFWIGSLIVFVAGALAMIDRRRKPVTAATIDKPIAVGSSKEAAA
ncbi:MAG: hypothetical protein ACREBV_05030, partial [Candidatus Zixiibacteriota bacterium]